MYNYFYFIHKRICGKKLMFCFSVVVSSLAMTLLCAAVIIPMILKHNEKMIRKALPDNTVKYGVFRNESYMDLENATDYILDIYNSPEIEGIGTWTYGGCTYLKSVATEMDYWGQILEIQNAHIREFNQDPNKVQIVYMPYQAFSINNLNMIRGSMDRLGQNEDYLLYLGYNFRNIPIGTKFLNEKNGKFYSVEGILEKNTTIVDAKTLLMNLGGLIMSCTISMDNMVLLIPPKEEDYLSSAFLFKCTEGFSYNDAMQRVQEISEYYGVHCETGKLFDRVDMILSAVDWLTEALSKLSVLLSFSAFVILLTTQLLMIMVRKDEIGVWSMFGISKNIIFKIHIVEKLLKLFLASSISFIILVLTIKIIVVQAGFSDAVLYSLRHIIWLFTPCLLILTSIIMALLCAMITKRYIQKKSIPELIKGTWE